MDQSELVRTGLIVDVFVDRVPDVVAIRCSDEDVEHYIKSHHAVKRSILRTSIRSFQLIGIEDHSTLTVVFFQMSTR